SKGGFVLSTARNMLVPVHIIVSEFAPSDESFDAWQQVNEASIEVPSGKIIIAGITDDPLLASRISLKAGRYRARIYDAHMDKLSEDGLDGEDHYRVHLWLAPSEDVRILKQNTLHEK